MENRSTAKMTEAVKEVDSNDPMMLSKVRLKRSTLSTLSELTFKIVSLKDLILLLNIPDLHKRYKLIINEVFLRKGLWYT